MDILELFQIYKIRNQDKNNEYNLLLRKKE